MKRLVIIGAGGRLGAALTRQYAGEFDVAPARCAGNPKSQGPSANQIPSSQLSKKLACIVPRLLIGVLRFGWDLGFGIWNFQRS
jgi:dTDP-4-dehydrorhamnose reductase